MSRKTRRAKSELGRRQKAYDALKLDDKRGRKKPGSLSGRKR